MQAKIAARVPPALRELVSEASRALSRLDAGRLEELALSCRVLNRGLADADPARWAEMTRQSREAERDLAVLGRVLQATQANLEVVRRIRALRTGRSLEYGEPVFRPRSSHGDD